MRVALALLILVSPAAIAQTDSPRTTRAGVYSAAQAERGKMQYALSCRSCHGGVAHRSMPAGRADLLPDSSALPLPSSSPVRSASG
jgi:hypothetical protein